MSMNMTLEELRRIMTETKGTPAEDGAERDKRIKVIDVNAEDVNKNGRDFIMLEVAYKDLDYNTVGAKRVPLFRKDQAKWIIGYPEEGIDPLESGKEYVVHQVKENGYWSWKSVELLKDED